MIYYFYYAGDKEFANNVVNAIKTKDYDAFMRLYKKEAGRDISRLPSHAWNDSANEDVYIINKENFLKIEECEYEWG